MKIPKGSTQPSLVLGVKMEAGNDDTHFCKPTDVAVASNGDFFVADGYSCLVSYIFLKFCLLKLRKRTEWHSEIRVILDLKN